MAIKGQTERGFGILHFLDSYGASCSLQESSSASEPKVWLGVMDVHPQVLTENGWRQFDLKAAAKGQEVHLSTRMHLTRDQARELIGYLQTFVDTGAIFPDSDGSSDEASE